MITQTFEPGRRLRLNHLLGGLALILSGALSGHATVIQEIEGNNSLAQAQNVDAFFSIDNDPFVTGATLTPHVSILGRGNFDGDRDFFRFTATAGSTAIFDIDQGMPDLDSWLNLYTLSGTHLWTNDDGNMLDAGSVGSFDSYGTYTFASTGAYVISVQRWPNAGMETDQDYRLNISVQNHALPQAVPEPGTVALLGMGLCGLAFAAKRRRAA